jgi:hypothetical protein
MVRLACWIQTRLERGQETGDLSPSPFAAINYVQASGVSNRLQNSRLIQVTSCSARKEMVVIAAEIWAE